MIETKVAVGSFAGVLTGFITWALVTYVPAFHSGLPGQVSALLPFGVAWLLGTVTSYAAPHTHRPDLSPVPAQPTAAPGMGGGPGV